MLTHALLILSPSLPPTSTRHVHSFISISSLQSSHRKCPNRFFDPIVRCTVSSPMMYSYTILRISSGSIAKNMLCPCACVRASSSGSGSDVKLMVDLRGRMEPWTESADVDLDENGLRDLNFCFRGPASCEGISCGIQRIPGNKPNNLAFIMGATCNRTTKNGHLLLAHRPV